MNKLGASVRAAERCALQLPTTQSTAKLLDISKQHIVAAHQQTTNGIAADLSGSTEQAARGASYQFQRQTLEILVF